MLEVETESVWVAGCRFQVTVAMDLSDDEAEIEELEYDEGEDLTKQTPESEEENVSMEEASITSDEDL